MNAIRITANNFLLALNCLRLMCSNVCPLISSPALATVHYQSLLSFITVGAAAKTQLAPRMHTVLISLVEPRHDVWP